MTNHNSNNNNNNNNNNNININININENDIIKENNIFLIMKKIEIIKNSLNNYETILKIPMILDIIKKLKNKFEGLIIRLNNDSKNILNIYRDNLTHSKLKLHIIEKNANVYKKIKKNNSELLECSNNDKIVIQNNVKINAIRINTNYFNIPNNNLYWINNVKQFGFKIGKVYFIGNINSINDYENTKKIPCKYIHNCQKLKNYESCDFVHFSQDNINSEKLFEKNYDIFNINYNYNSWKFVNYFPNIYKNFKRYNFQKNNINNEFKKIKKSIQNDKYTKKLMKNYFNYYISQIMHDILIVLAAKEYGLF